jgi:8-oxo-dGTP pyrophosphatase MutT (NUDIX family)
LNYSCYYNNYYYYTTMLPSFFCATKRLLRKPPPLTTATARAQQQQQQQHILELLCFSTSIDFDDHDAQQQQDYQHQRVWKSSEKASRYTFWEKRVIDQQDKSGKFCVDAVIAKIVGGRKEHQRNNNNRSGTMRQTFLGVLHSDPATDIEMLVDNYTVKAVASALRDREDALQRAAELAADNRIEELKAFLQIYHPKYVLERRQNQNHQILTMENSRDDGKSAATTWLEDDPVTALHTDASRQVLRRTLMRMPRLVTTAHTKRAAVCLALCLANGVPSILLEKRAKHLRTHPDEVCLPGGMVCDVQDKTIVATSIREMKEEIRGLDQLPMEVLGILRLNWSEVHHLTGVAVTPVVCYLGELPETLSPQPDEVAEIFTIRLSSLLDPSLWVYKEGLAPIFLGGPHVTWGLTGYILERFGKHVLRPLHCSSFNQPSPVVPLF